MRDPGGAVKSRHLETDIGEMGRYMGVFSGRS